MTVQPVVSPEAAKRAQLRQEASAEIIRSRIREKFADANLDVQVVDYNDPNRATVLFSATTLSM